MFHYQVSTEFSPFLGHYTDQSDVGEEVVEETCFIIFEVNVVDAVSAGVPSWRARVVVVDASVVVAVNGKLLPPTVVEAVVAVLTLLCIEGMNGAEDEVTDG